MNGKGACTLLQHSHNARVGVVGEVCDHNTEINHRYVATSAVCCSHV